MQILKCNEYEIETVEHPPTWTTEEADAYIKGIDGVRTKTLFLTNKKKTAFYLLIMDDQQRLDMDKFRDLVGANRIRMASADSLFQKMKLRPGMVSPFGLLLNEEGDVLLYMDRAIESEKRMSFHPNTNEKTIFLATKDLFLFCEEIGYPINIVDL
ncbi:prolyl-tRNA synthetase associated domain-containing protein [Streptococcus sp. 121]|uniref:prolyl-tRNA synthetase associated domain-containing protein n=1 Tax=Streptococcus sp. 121 TaxID=2797637 RepID=UPI0018F0634E|nr:prolyl-tRNA synthetase associated domain-containing protein [Streptococcus sp. 121]MBJ6745344.1 prolyl-tRNA synthetase associated domain-containing protein [Streptococcus sp. 121]